MKELQTKEEFDKFLKDAGSKLVVIDFFAIWCGPCKVFEPKFKKMEEEFSDACFAKVNVDENEETSEAEEISAMPTFKFYKDGKQVAELTGANEDKFRALIKEHLKK